MPQLRTYTPSDAAGCCTVIRACLPLLEGLDDAALGHVAAKLTPDTLHAELGPADALVVTDPTGRVLALGALAAGELVRLYVLPDRQRQGLGTALVDALEARARAGGVRQLTLEAAPNAVAFFRRRGFVGREVVERRVGEATFQVVPMTKAIAR